ncbi:MAG: hypothetical protein FWE67_12725 [Planctomycetaceae bacterium]|nr:hypothetical protein [Planctomycetaceae bacterium]
MVQNTTMTDSDLPKPLWKSPIFIVSMAICLLIFLFGAYLFFIWAPPLIISPATTRITGPLTAKGDIDFFKALEQRFYPPELATDDNGFRDFVRLFGDVSGMPHDPEFYCLQKYEKLGLDPNIAPTLTLPLAPDVVVENFYKAKGEELADDLRRELFDRPWTLRDYPMLEEWLKDIDTPLDAIAEAIRKPVFFAPFLQNRKSVESGNPQNLLELLLLDIRMLRNVARMFQARANYRIAQGNIDGAIEDKLILKRLGRLVPQGGPLFHYRVGHDIEKVGTGILVGTNPKHPLTEKQIRRLLDGLDTLPPRMPLNDVFEWERYQGLSAVQDVSKEKYPFLVHFVIYPLPIVMYNCNWNIVYIRMNEMYDALQEPSPRTKYNLLLERTSPPITEFEQIKFYCSMISPNGRGHRVADACAALCQALDGIEERVWCSECADNLQRLSLAVLLYQCENDKLPDENWAAQIEKYLGENPKQYFSCPTNPSPEGETTYAMVQYGDKVDSRNVLMLVELSKPVALEKAVVSVDDVFNRRNTGSMHRGGMNAAHYSAAVRFLNDTVDDEEELRRLLGF